MTGSDVAGSDVEGPLAARVLDALLREDYAGLRRRVDGRTLALPGRPVRLVDADPAFLSELRVDPSQNLALRDVFAAVRHLADPRDDTDAWIGFAPRSRPCRRSPVVKVICPNPPPTP